MITKQQVKDRTNKINFLKRIEKKFRGWEIQEINKRLESYPFLLDEFKLIEKEVLTQENKADTGTQTAKKQGVKGLV